MRPRFMTRGDVGVAGERLERGRERRREQFVLPLGFLGHGGEEPARGPGTPRRPGADTTGETAPPPYDSSSKPFTSA